ncbi:T-cell surface glycoprotein CD5 [Apteryx mantelli]|uniref:T-cell surface glycoprotein CD5 n=1 Tax=Apteryx mantelli TaxID=2696672 RepID=A0ABM4EF60_9AVES
MAARHPALGLLLAVGTWALSSCGEAAPSPKELALRLAGAGCRCSGALEVKLQGQWRRVTQDTVRTATAAAVCKHLGCGPPAPEDLQVTFSRGKEACMRLLGCRETAPLAECSWIPTNCTDRATLTCSEPAKTTSEPTPAPETTTPEPAGAARLRLVDGNFSCSGFVELYRQGLWGAVAADAGAWPELAPRICEALRCGGLISDRSTVPEAGSHLPVRWEMERSCKRRSVLDCFNRTSDRRGKAPAFVVCSGSQPRATRRLAGGLTPCEGHIEVFHGDRWQALCDEPGQRAERAEQMCQELRCGKLSSSSALKEPPAMGIACAARNLHLCPAGRGGLRTCSRTGVVCQDSKPPAAGLGAGTIVSIFLALVLFGILLLLCGPPAYKRLMKKISKKKQRQWIGPTGFNQNVSFHRTSTVNLRPRAEGLRAQGEDNDYAQPPKKNPYLSAYPALEGASRSSNPPDNSSDSDYDLHSARRV